MILFLVCSLVAGALAAPQNYYQNQGRYRQGQDYNNPGQYYNPQQQYYQGQYQNQYSSGNQVPITSATNEVNPDGSYSYSYSTGDGQQAQAQGYQKSIAGSPEPGNAAQGSYSYTAPDGTPINVNWIADEFGFRAEGAHLPTPPPIPKEIQQSLALIARTQNLSPSQIPQYNQAYNDQGQYNAGQYNQAYNNPYRRNY